MKRVSPHTVVCLVLGMIAPLSAQNLIHNPTSSETSLKVDEIPQRLIAAFALPGSFELPTSPYRKVMMSAHAQPYELSEGGLQAGLALASAIYREVEKTEQTQDCPSISLSVELRVKLDPSKTLEIVEREVGANPDCSCEIVKSAIKASEANVDQVVSIVETAIHASPESMRIISQCAIATMPESIARVQSLLAKLDPNAGEAGYSSKGAKGAKSAKVAIVASMFSSPLDRPLPAISPPPPIFPTPVTEVDPRGPYD